MASYLRPRRGKLATATSQNIILKRGEVFFEVPTGGVGTGIGKIKMGDGTTAYSSLPYFLQQATVDVANSAIAFTADTTTSNATLLGKIASGAKLNVIVAAVKKLLSNLDASVTSLNNDLEDINAVIADCNSPTAILGYCDANTLNTPYKDGLTSSTLGRCYSNYIKMDGDNTQFNNQIFACSADGTIYTRSCNNGTWTSWELLNAASPLGHNGIYRGKDLGTITSANVQTFLNSHKVSTGEFKDIYVGDTVIIQDGVYNARWVVAGLDTELNRGDTPLTTHGISLIPVTSLFNAPMNATNTTVGGYFGSVMHTSTLPTVATNLQKALGNHLLKRRVLLSNSMSATLASGAGAGWVGSSNGWAWYDAYCTLLSEVQVYGSTVFASSFYDIGEACNKLPIFNFINHVLLGRVNFWLRSATSSLAFARADVGGLANDCGASDSLGVRPLIVIG